MRAIGIKTNDLEAGNAEIGFLIPRNIFRNHLEQLVKELGVVNRIIRIFSEASVGRVEQVEVISISTSDPVFLFGGLEIATILMLANVIKWAISVWADVENVRKVRAETKKLNLHTEAEIKSLFDDKIDETIQKRINEHVSLMLPADEGPGRNPELRSQLGWALESVLSRVELGLKVEIRSLEAPEPNGEVEDELTQKRRAAFSEVQKIKQQLIFPKFDGPPIRKLPPSEPPTP